MNNITKLIRNDEKINILKLLSCDEKYTDGRASDFEWFEAWEGAMLLCAGHREYKSYADILSEFQLTVTEPERISRLSCIERWRTVNALLLNVGQEERRACKSTREEGSVLENIFPRFAVQKEGHHSVEIKKTVSEFITEFDSIQHMSDSISEECVSSEKPCIFLTVDLYDTEYIRPDPYLGGKAFEKKKSGEKLNETEENVLASQLISELLIRLREKKKTDLLFRSGGQSEAALSLIKYLVRRRLLDGNVFVKLDDISALDALSRTAVEVYPKIYIRPTVFLNETSLTKEELTRLFYRYPVGAFCFPRGEEHSALEAALASVSVGRSHDELLKSRICISLDTEVI